MKGKHRMRSTTDQSATTLVFLVGCALVPLIALCSCTEETGEMGLAVITTPPPEQPGTLTYQTEPETLLLELAYEGGMIANPDPTPFVRVYGNGRVVVHYPDYMKKAGDYELELSEEEIESLLQSFSDQSLLTLRYRLASTLCASATVGGGCDGAACPFRWAAR